MKVNALKLILKDLRGKFGETNFKRQEKKKSVFVNMFSGNS